VISVCDSGGQEPVTVGGALAMLDRALDVLNAADAGSLPVSVQAQALRALARAEAKHTAARARVLTAFTAQDGYEDDGQGSARVWLRWQTRVSKGAAAGSVAWMRRLAAHPAVGEALAAGDVSASWAREMCDWSDRLPQRMRAAADAILVAAARGGADEAGLGRLAQEMYERSHGDGDGDDDGFDDRALWLAGTIGGAGRLDGDLSPGCYAALSAVLTALAAKAGPEDTRTAAQRRHDALEEACRRLIAAGMLPGRAGQARQVMVHINLAQLRATQGASDTERTWADWWAGQAAGRAGWLTGAEATAAACDATLVPVVTGHVDPAALDRLVEAFLAGHGQEEGHQPARARAPLSPHARERLRRTLLALAAGTLSGPGGLAARLRAGLDDRLLASVSLPLDVGGVTETIPAHLRRLVILRHPHCAFPGCGQPASVCDVHHLIPRAAGGPAALHNLVPLCAFHHLVVIHRWGWKLVLHTDGSTSATSPDGRIFHSHSPPAHAA
jgi:hypothetical protein